MPAHVGLLFGSFPSPARCILLYRAALGSTHLSLAQLGLRNYLEDPISRSRPWWARSKRIARPAVGGYNGYASYAVAYAE